MASDFILEGNTGQLWHLWYRKYGAHTDSGDAGFIMKRDDGFEAFTRGDMPQSIGTFATLEAAAANLENRF
jgi:hypothetical protein